MSYFAVSDVIDLAFGADGVVKSVKCKVATELSSIKKHPKLLLGPSTTLAPPVIVVHPPPSSQGSLTSTSKVSQALPLSSHGASFLRESPSADLTGVSL